MATQSTKTYLQIVNDSIDEAGAELASFAANGSDWTTNTDPMMNRFKKWANKAWRDLQVEANDWHWLDETAVVNITPGIMFYSPNAITWDVGDINPMAIRDVDSNIMVNGLTATKVVDLTGKYSYSQPFGYVDCKYSDYTPLNAHVLDFGMKSGGFRLERDSDSLLGFVASFNGANEIGILLDAVEGDAVTSLSILDPSGPTLLDFPIVNGKLVSKNMGTNYASIKVTADSVPDSFYQTLISMAHAQIDEFTFELHFNVNITTSAGDQTLNGRITMPDPSHTPALPFPVSAAISPLNYVVHIGPTSIYDVDTSASNIKSYRFHYTSSSLGSKFYTHNIDVIATRTAVFNDPANTNSFVELSISDDSCLSQSEGGTGSTVSMEAVQPMSVFTTLLYMQLPSFTWEVDYLTFLSTPVGQVPVTNVQVFSGTSPSHYAFTYPYLYTFTNYVHTWKSFDWNEENDVDDFVESIRQTNNATYRIISHDDPAVACEAPLQFVPWDTFQNKYDFASSPPGIPRIISEDNTGRFRLYPAPDRPYTIMFDYIREPQELEEYTDVPRGLPRAYEDMVMWLTVRAYGEYDEQPSVVARANKRYKDLLLTLQQEYRPVFHFKPKRLY